MQPTTTRSAVLAVPAAVPSEAQRHFSARLSFETDCTDVSKDVKAGSVPYTIVDVRGRDSHARGHVPGALSVPTSTIDQDVADGLPGGLLVVYCWGPGCNGAQRSARVLAECGREVKEMIGGFEYWVREGLPVVGSNSDTLARLAEPELVG